MQYVLLIYDDEKTWASLSESEEAKGREAYMAFTEDIKQKGQHRAGEALQPVATATSVRKKGGKIVTTDGPFAETKEQLGGFYLVEAKDLDEAISLAARIPSVAFGGTVEVRPVVDFSKQ